MSQVLGYLLLAGVVVLALIYEPVLVRAIEQVDAWRSQDEPRAEGVRRRLTAIRDQEIEERRA